MTPRTASRNAGTASLIGRLGALLAKAAVPVLARKRDEAPAWLSASLYRTGDFAEDRRPEAAAKS